MANVELKDSKPKKQGRYFTGSVSGDIYLKCDNDLMVRLSDGHTIRAQDGKFLPINVESVITITV